MGVVLRCSNCGTVQAQPGVCDACHEAQVRYFCTNHTPGTWLDAARCPQCGARWGEVEERADTPPRDASPVDKRPRWARKLGVGEAPASGRPRPGRALPGTDSFEDDASIAEREAAARRLWDLLASARRSREISAPPIRDLEDVPAPRAGGGCLGRMMLVVFLFFALFIVIPLVLGGALFQLM